MPRGTPSQADLALIAEVAAHGFDVSAYQLERWRIAGLLANPTRVWLGRGRGSVSIYPPEALQSALFLAEHGGQGRSRHRAALGLFVSGLPVREDAVRDAYCWRVDRQQSQIERAAARGPEGIYDEAERARSRVSAYEPALLHHHFPNLMSDEPSVPTSAAARSRAAHRLEIKSAVWLSVMALHDPAELAPDDLANMMEAFGLASAASKLRTEIYAAAREGRSFAPGDLPNPLNLMREQARELPMESLRQATQAACLAGASTWLLQLAALVDSSAWELLATVYADEQFAITRTLELVGSHRPEGIVFPTLVLAANPGLLQVTLAYGEWLLPQAIRFFVQATKLAVSQPDEVQDTAFESFELLAQRLSEPGTSSERGQPADPKIFGAAVATAAKIHRKFAGEIHRDRG